MDMQQHVENNFEPGAELLLVAENDFSVHVLRTEEGIRPCQDAYDVDGWDWLDWDQVLEVRVIRKTPSDDSPLDKLHKAMEDYTEAVYGSSAPLTGWVAVIQTSRYNKDKIHGKQFPILHQSNIVASPTLPIETLYGLLRTKSEEVLSHF